MAPRGDVTIVAKKVDIVEARETTNSETEQKFKQTGLSVGLSNPIVSAVQTAQGMAQAASNTGDGRMQALAGAAAALNGYNTYNSLTDTAGNFSVEKATDVSVNISLGTSKNQSNSSSTADTARGSTVAAGNNLTIAATGAGQDSNLLIQGSIVTASNNATLAADNQVNLLAAKSTASSTSSNSSSSSSVGVSYGVKSGFGVSASASKGQGNSNGSDTSYTNTEVTAGNTAIITSGGDSNFKGAVVAANTVKANVGGNLNIESLQDTSTYTSKQSSSGGSISFSTGGFMPVGGGVSAGKSNIDSNYASVMQQSGIKAGDGGFQVSVAGNTDLKGSVIASTQAAVALNRNTFTTGSLSFSDIRNSASYKGTGYGLSVDVGEQKGKFGVNGVGAGIGSDKGEASSISSSGISGIAGNTAVRSTDAETGIAKIFDADRVQKEINAQVAAKTVEIVEAREASRTEIEQKFKQSGLTLEVTSPVISALQTIDKMSEAASQTKDSRMQALAGANMAFAANNAYNAIQAGQNTTGNNPSAATEHSAAEQAGGINLAISVGSSKSQSNSLSESNTGRGSNITAGNNIIIAATGGGQASNLTIQGSTVEAGKAVQLIAENEARLLAAQNLASERSTNSSSSGSLGVSFGTDGFLVNVSASKGKGRTNGDDTSYTNTQIKAGEKVSLTTGGDATLQGAVIRAKQVKADIGGNLNITSLQDSSTYTSSQQSMGGSLSVGVGKISGSVSASKSNIDSNFQSVAQQSGIKAGSGGFQVSVAGNTALLGSVIASDTQAVNAQKNSFKTGGTLSISDIQNTASYKGESIGISFGGGATAKTAGINGLGIGLGSDKGDASSTSSAGISGIAGNTAVRSTDAETGLKPIFDAVKVQAEINAQVQITQAFTREAPKAAASFAENQARALRIEKNEDEAKKWDEGGIYRIALHTVIGALGGGVDGALGAATSASSANLQQSLQDAGLGDGVAKSIAQVVAGLTAAGIGAAVGGTQGAATAWTVDANNRQLHKDEIALAKKYAKQVAKAGGISVEEATARIERQLLRWTDAATNAYDGGRVDELVVGQIGISGKDTATGMQWDYRNYAQTHPNEYFDATINQQNISQYSPLLANSNYGLTPAQVAQRAHDGIVTTLTAAACGFTGIGCVAMSGFNIGEGGIKLANGEILAVSVQTAGGFLGLGLSLYGPISAAIKNVANGATGVPAGASTPANSANAGVGLRNDLSIQAGVPTSTSNIWGASLDDLKQAFNTGGATITPGAARPSSSGNSQIIIVEGSSTGVVQVQYSPASTQSTHGGQYYKFTYADGAELKVIDPANYRVLGWPENGGKTTFLNPGGKVITYDPVSKTWR